MADTKISALPASSTPLAGTEVLPIVQSSTTVKVSVANLTAGRAVATGALTVTGTLSATGTLSGGTSGTGYSFSGSAPAGSLTLDSSGNLSVLSIGSPAEFSSSNASNTLIQQTNTSASRDLIYRLRQNAGTGNWYDLTMEGSTNAFTIDYNDNERLRIDSSGNLLVGKTSGGGAVGPRVEVDNTNNTSGDNGLFVYLGGNCSNTSSSAFSSLITGVGNKFHVYGNGNVVNTNNSYGAISDVKFKENIVDATPKLNDVLNLKVRNFNLKTEPNNKQIGFIAQEFEEVFPSMIDVSPDTDVNGKTLETTHKSIKLSVLVPILVKAIQEQQALITQLTARITALETP